MDIEKLIAEARPGNFTVSTVLDNLVAGDEVRIELQSGNRMEGTVKFKNSRTLALDVPGFGFWACRVSMIAGVGIPGKTKDPDYRNMNGEAVTGTQEVAGERDANVSPVATGDELMMKLPKEKCPACSKNAPIMTIDDTDGRYKSCMLCSHRWPVPTPPAPKSPPAQRWKCGGCGVVIYSLNQPRCEECKRLMKKWNRANDAGLTKAEQLADDEIQARTAAVEDEEASDVPDEKEFEKTEEELEAERAI